MIILALESSTTSAKALLFDSETGQIVVHSRRFDVPGPDAAVRDPDRIYAQTVALGRETAGERPVDLVVLGGTWHGLGFIDRELRAVTPVREWPDTSAQDLCARLRADSDFTRWFYERTGCLVNASYPAFKAMHLQEQGLALAGLVAIDQPTLTFARLTGEVATTASLASGTGLLGAASLEWDSVIRRRLGLDELGLPELRGSTDAAPLSAEGAGLLGLRPGIPVLLPGPDGGLSQVGDRATEPGDMTFSMGTSGALRIASRDPAFSPSLSTWSYRSPLGPLSGAATSGCGNCVDWARERMFGLDTDYSEIEPLLSADRTELPVFLPFLFGERSPGWQDRRRGGFLELQQHHDRVDLYQSVLEGIVFSLYHCFTQLTALHGMPRRIVLSGGVLSSPFWTQLTADVFGQELEVSPVQHSSLVGAVRMGLLSSGLGLRHPAFDEREPRRVRPDGRRRGQYDAAFSRYLDHYGRTRMAPEIAG